MTGPDDEGEIVICYGGAQPTDIHLISVIHAVDEEIFEVLKRRERRRRGLSPAWSAVHWRGAT